jgi:hypothetical protein
MKKSIELLNNFVAENNLEKQTIGQIKTFAKKHFNEDDYEPYAKAFTELANNSLTSDTSVVWNEDLVNKLVHEAVAANESNNVAMFTKIPNLPKQVEVLAQITGVTLYTESRYARRGSDTNGLSFKITVISSDNEDLINKRFENTFRFDDKGRLNGKRFFTDAFTMKNYTDILPKEEFEKCFNANYADGIQKLNDLFSKVDFIISSVVTHRTPEHTWFVADSEIKNVFTDVMVQAEAKKFKTLFRGKQGVHVFFTQTVDVFENTFEVENSANPAIKRKVDLAKTILESKIEAAELAAKKPVQEAMAKIELDKERSKKAVIAEKSEAMQNVLSLAKQYVELGYNAKDAIEAAEKALGI